MIDDLKEMLLLLAKILLAKCMVIFVEVVCILLVSFTCTRSWQSQQINASVGCREESVWVLHELDRWSEREAKQWLLSSPCGELQDVF